MLQISNRRLADPPDHALTCGRPVATTAPWRAPSSAFVARRTRAFGGTWTSTWMMQPDRRNPAVAEFLYANLFRGHLCSPTPTAYAI